MSIETFGRNERPGAAGGLSTADTLWALGIWAAILGLSPVIVFYFLMVN